MAVAVAPIRHIVDYNRYTSREHADEHTRATCKCVNFLNNRTLCVVITFTVGNFALDSIAIYDMQITHGLCYRRHSHSFGTL